MPSVGDPSCPNKFNITHIFSATTGKRHGGWNTCHWWFTSMAKQLQSPPFFSASSWGSSACWRLSPWRFGGPSSGMSWGFWCSSSGSMCVKWCTKPVSVLWIACVYLKMIQRRRVNVSMVWPLVLTNPITSSYCGHRDTSADCGACVPASSEFMCVSAIWFAYVNHVKGCKRRRIIGHVRR